ncbi:invasion associated locus B family protein [uncultured Tateyamaria sp.]|uniref:invasion associated locus B family protein n=1 Tax=uncultured Tateyamaria sp. TaxID=455651 RepID=UPI0026276D9E|nr:invasion associated locus B family protein [uncultured Tateyamaria sp.]
MTRSKGLVWCLSLALVCGSAGSGWAQATPVSASVDEQQFSDWRVVCSTGDAPKTCQLLQAAQAAPGAADVFLLTITPDAAADDFAVITVPLGVYLVPGIEIQVDERRPFKVLFEICDQRACYAGFRLAGPVFAAFRQGLDAKVRVWTGREKAVEFPVSLRGFSAAMAHYEAQTAP